MSAQSDALRKMARRAGFWRREALANADQLSKAREDVLKLIASNRELIASNRELIDSLQKSNAMILKVISDSLETYPDVAAECQRNIVEGVEAWLRGQR
jgi:hypothetical protein